jgi:hypothetical protein
MFLFVNQFRTFHTIITITVDEEGGLCTCTLFGHESGFIGCAPKDEANSTCVCCEKDLNGYYWATTCCDFECDVCYCVRVPLALCACGCDTMLMPCGLGFCDCAGYMESCLVCVICAKQRKGTAEEIEEEHRRRSSTHMEAVRASESEINAVATNEPTDDNMV